MKDTKMFRKKKKTMQKKVRDRYIKLSEEKNKNHVSI